MNTFVTSITSKQNIKNIILDISAITFIYFVPSISHLLNLPVYFIEPMRLMIILALVHSTKQNAYILALTLPLFSFLVSAHPVLPKMFLITFELCLNVFLFFILVKKFKNLFFPIFISILGSKLIYYIIKFGLIHFVILKSGLISTPLLIQAIMTFVFSIYLMNFYKK